MRVIHLLKCLRPEMLHPLCNLGHPNNDVEASASVPIVWADDR